MRAQPRGRRGTVGHPYSPLTLRLVLAAFGFVTSVGLGVVLLATGFTWLGIALLVLAATALADLVVIQLRRRAGRVT